MPPRTSTASSMPFSVQADQQNEVVCPLKNSDGSNCRKRCFGEKRYRSIQEHIRRAHPEHYIPKLPATEESFQLMINSTPTERPQQNQFQPNHQQQPQFQQQQQQQQQSQQPQTSSSNITSSNYTPDQHALYNNFHSSLHSPHSAKSPVDFRRPSQLPTANAAAALAQLSNSRPGDGWDNEQATFSDQDQTLHNYFANSDAQNMFGDGDGNSLTTTQMTKEALQNFIAGNNRAASLQPFQRKPNRPRKASVTESARKPKHERQRSKDQKRISSDRKAFSAEPGASLLGNKRWEDLLDAAASATEEDGHELTPIPQSPRASVPPQSTVPNHNAYQSYTTSPLQNTVLPHSPDEDESFVPPPALEAFPSVEPSFEAPAAPSFHQQQSSGDSSLSQQFAAFGHQPGHSGSNFHILPRGLSSSPNDTAAALTHMRSYSGSQQYRPQTGHSQQAPAPLVQHYCAACHRITPLNSSYACTECICGICRDCVDVLMGMGPDRNARCPRCGTVGGRFKPFMLDLR